MAAFHLGFVGDRLLVGLAGRSDEMRLALNVHRLGVRLRSTLAPISRDSHLVPTGLPLFLLLRAIGLVARALRPVLLRPVARVALLLRRAALHGTLVDRVDQRNLTVGRPGVILLGLPVRRRVRSVRVQRLLAVLGHLVQTFDLEVALVRLQARGRLHAVLDGGARGDEALLALPAVLAVVEAVTRGGAPRVLRMLRDRVLRLLVIYFGHACSDNLIALVLVLTQSEGGLRHQ